MFISRIIFVVALALLAPSAATAQFFATCETASLEELRKSINGHNEHVARMNRKFQHYWYFQGTVDASQFELEYEEILEFLRRLYGRRAAVLFYAHNESPSRLCTWLVSPHLNPNVISHSRNIDISRLTSIRVALFDSLGIGRRSSNRAPWRGIRPSSGNIEETEERRTMVNAALQEASDILIPQSIAGAIAARIDTLVIVPMTVIYGTKIYGNDAELAKNSEAPTTSIGTLPFAALPVGDRQLIDIASIVISPGFATFKLRPREARRDFLSPVIVGDPSGRTDAEWNFPELPGAAAEAEAIAAELESSALLTGPAVNVAAVRDTIQPDTGLIHLATHGIASRQNPLDGSFLWLNARWSARQISQLSLDGHPLVVLSACQTGLGKEFAVGTTGLARAWLQSGASSVVMSLWNVDDSATRDLMTSFIRRATDEPVDRALREAMRETRHTHPNPFYWAGFTTFGAPELAQ
jgi:hypothetical protein